MPPQSDVATKRRLALIIACSEYRDPTLQQLRAPARDAEAFADVLQDPGIGDFEVRTLLNLPSAELFRGIAEFCADSSPQDLHLIYLSCHGVLDDRGRLYYATANTERRLLAATSVSAQWLNDQLEDCRARQQLLILDCCHSGAFAKGMKGDATLALQDRFSGRGRVVLTASRATEYSFEGNQVLGEGVVSVFTAAVVEGLRTGDADRDKDGLITVTDLYDHVYDRTHAADSRQTPELWTYGAEGNILVARSPRGAVVTPIALPEDLRATLDSPRPRVRESAVAELADLLDQAEPGLVLTAQLTLARIAEEDIPRLAGLARVALRAGRGLAAGQVRAEVEERARREAAVRAELEEEVRREAEEQTRREAEEQTRREAEEQARHEAEDQARHEAEDQARHEAEDQARREAEDQARHEAGEQTRHEAEGQARREAEEQTRPQAEEQTRPQAEEQTRPQAEEQTRPQAEEQTRPQAEEQTRPQAEEQTRPQAEEATEEHRGDAHEEVQLEAPGKLHSKTRRRVALAVFSASLGVGIALVLISHLRPADSTRSQLPSDLRPSCTAAGGTSFNCHLDANTVAIYSVFPTAEDARANVVSQDKISDTCPPTTPTPPSGTPLVCEYTFGTQRGVARFSYINKGLQFYQALWNPDGKKVTGTLSSKQASEQDWATLWANWSRLAAMH